MSVMESTYYAFERIREQGPEAADWSATDWNWDNLSKLVKQMENHSHNGNVALQYPGYNSGTPTSPFLPVGSVIAGSGFLTPGSAIGFRISFMNAARLETAGTQEIIVTVPGASSRPLAPQLTATTALAAALPGGNYFYAITKVKGTGESAMSDVLPVSIPYDKTYSATLSFGSINSYATIAIVGNIATGTATVKAIASTANLTIGMTFTGTGIPANTYIASIDSSTQITLSANTTTTTTGGSFVASDGTTALNIYRSTGLDGGFSKITQITAGATTSFVDTNTIAPENVNVTPPTTSTFDATRAAKLDWSALTMPSGATAMRVYVTQQPGLWSYTHLVKEIDMTVGGYATQITYQGNETLLSGWPRNDGQIPSSPGQINLSTDATGGFSLTADSDVKGFLMKNMTLGGSPTITKVNGMIWHDSTAKTIIARLNGVDITVGTVTGAYSHPTESSGGHTSSLIPFVASGVSVKSILDTIVTSTGGRKNVQGVVRVPAVTTNPTTSLSTASMIPEMTNPTTPDFANQFIKIEFEGHFLLSSLGMNLSIAIELDGITQENSVRTVTSPGVGGNVSMHCSDTYPLSAAAHTIKILWWVDIGTATAVNGRRQLTVTRMY